MEQIKKYQYMGIQYEKRNLTKDILLKIITKDYGLVQGKSETYTAKAKPLKNSEMVSQQDACPVEVNQELEAVMKVLKRHNEHIRARHTQMSPVFYTQKEFDIREDNIDFLLANGTVAVFAKDYKKGVEEQLLQHGILPLITKEDLLEDDFIFIENILSDLKKGEQKVQAYKVENNLVPISVFLPMPSGSLEQYKQDVNV